MLWILIVLLLIALASGPWYPYSTNWGYAPFSTIFGLLIIILVVWVIFGRTVPPP